MIYDTGLYGNRNINHLKILAMSCSYDHAVFLQRKSNKPFTIQYTEAFSGMSECFFMRKYVFHNFSEFSHQPTDPEFTYF